MDPFSLMWIGAMVWFIKTAVEDRAATASSRAAARDARLDARAAASPRQGRPPHIPRLDAPRRSARLGSRITAGLSTYPALAWMIPAELFRGARHGLLVGRYYRRNGGDLAAARRQAEDTDTARGRRVPGARTNPTPGNRGASQPRTDTPPAGTDPQQDVPADRPIATAKNDITDAEVIKPTRRTNDTPTPDTTTAPKPTTTPADTTGPEPGADNSTPAPQPEGTPAMGDIATSPDMPANPGNLADGGDYNTVELLAKHGMQLGEELQELASQVESALRAYTRYAESVGAEAAGLRLDNATQTDITELESGLSEYRAAQARAAAASEAITEAASTLHRNLTRRHGAIREAVVDSPVNAAHSEFYKETV